MKNFLLVALTVIFLIESFAEIRLFGEVRTIFPKSGRAQPTKRVARILKIESQWSWISWIFLLLLFVLPDVYTFLLICIITLIETCVVYELQNAKNYAQNINSK